MITVNSYKVDSAPLAPSSATISESGLGEVTLTWTDNSSNETGFIIDYSLNAAAYVFLANDTASSYVHFPALLYDALNGNSLTLRVRAYNGTGESENAISNTLTLVNQPS